MEREDDVQLIQRTLSGDDTAFGILLQRYQKSVHALVWRKIGDFHIAEDITQDTFLQAYKKLSTLKNPNQFAGWLYVIADRLCIDWSRKRRLRTQLLEDTPVEEIERASYIHHVSEVQEAERTERRYELVKKLLAKLPESERTVVTLFYLGEMTTKEIGKFLGVSVGTIKSRLRRGRKRLQEDEELMIQEVFGGVQIPASLGENVMRQVADMKPIASPVSKPFLPWTALGTAVIVNEKTCYKANVFGIHRTADGGESWHLFMNGMIGTVIIDLVAFGNRLYAHNGYEVYQSTDAGVSWKIVPADRQKAGFSPFSTRVTPDLKLMVVGDILYFLLTGGPTGATVGIFHLSTDGDRLISVQGVPIFDRYKLADEKYTSKERDYLHVSRLRTETAAASRNVFYIEYIGELFKWKLGDPEWTSTGLIEDNPLYYNASFAVFKLATSGETVYAGKWNGKLFQSLDEGESWRDVTPTLPLRFTHFKDIIFAGSSVYVATDNGVMASQTGENWRVLTDGIGTRVVIAKFAVDGTTVYGTGDAGGYRLDARTQWEQISSEVPNVISDLVIANDKLYGATDLISGAKEMGLFYISLEEDEKK